MRRPRIGSIVLAMEPTRIAREPQTTLRIEFDPASPRVRGRVFTCHETRPFDGWIQLSALLEELRGVRPQAQASRQSEERI
jgi:hypothetical protein